MLAIAAYIGLQMSNVYVPDDFERPYYYKTMLTVFQFYGKAVIMLKFKSLCDEIDPIYNFCLLT
jgi:hypothetical protein